MDNQIIKNFELEQLNNFCNNDSVLKLKKICSQLNLQFKSGISNLEDFNLNECKKKKLLHCAYLFFEVKNDGKTVDINNDDYGSLCWSTCISKIKTNNTYDTFNWYDDSDINEEIESITKLLTKFGLKEELIAYIETTKIKTHR